MPENDATPRPSFKDRAKTYIPHAAAFAIGVVMTASVIRYRNGIGFNEMIITIPIDEARAMVAEGSKYILETPKGDILCAKFPRQKL